VKIFRFGHHHIVPPRVMGHEVAGEIVEVGESVSGHRVGDAVQVIAAIPCGHCAECSRGRMTVCANQESMGYHYDGGFAEYMIIPAKVLAVGGVNPIPEGVSFAEASVAEPLACVLNGQELARVGEGDDVMVIGSGPIGCLHVRMARANGAARVFLADLNPARLEQAAALVKPDATICSADTDLVRAALDLTEGRGPDVVITAAAAGAVQEQALRMAARTPLGLKALCELTGLGPVPASLEPTLRRLAESRRRLLHDGFGDGTPHDDDLLADLARETLTRLQ
jgi:L-iditol 2-dehydrogenase